MLVLFPYDIRRSLAQKVHVSQSVPFPPLIHPICLMRRARGGGMWAPELGAVVPGKPLAAIHRMMFFLLGHRAAVLIGEERNRKRADGTHPTVGHLASITP